ncbi:MAG: outer membrane protein TolC [Planctomycetota bacterium]
MRIPQLFSIALLGCAACRSAQDYRIAADDEVYGLINDRRSQLFGEEGSFTIDPAEGSLRSQVIAGEIGELNALTLAKCLDIAAENTREYQSRKEALYRAALDLTLERWRLGWQANLGGDIGIAGLGDTASGATGGGGLGLTKVLGTGAQIFTDLGIAIAKDLSGGGGWTAQSSFGFLFSQPLMRGAGGWIVYEDLTQAERTLVYEIRSFERFRRELAVDLAARILRLLQNLNIIDNERRNYENVSKIRERNESLSEAGRMSDIQVDQARQNEYTSQNRLINARVSYYSLLDSFKLLLGLPMSVDLSVNPNELESLAEIGKGLKGVDEQLATELAYQNREDFKTIVDRVVDAERRSRVAADALRMRLDITSSVDVSSDARNPLKFNFQDVSWSLGLLIDLPIDRTPERNNYRSSLITWQSAARNAAEFEDTIALSLRNELRELESSAESRDIQAEAVVLAEKRVESATLNIEAGRAETRDLLEAQDALVSSRNLETRALIDYTLAQLDLVLDMGILRVNEQGILFESISSLRADEESK